MYPINQAPILPKHWPIDEPSYLKMNNLEYSFLFDKNDTLGRLIEDATKVEEMIDF